MIVAIQKSYFAMRLRPSEQLLLEFLWIGNIFGNGCSQKGNFRSFKITIKTMEPAHLISLNKNSYF